MIKTARQLKDLIRNLSRKKSADAQLLMRNYMMERFLERISLSEYRDKFILKGGMLVAAMVGLDARSTMDLDATVKGANVNVEDIENLISAIVSVPLDDGVKFQLKSISEIMDEAEYPGIRVNMTTTFDGVVTPLKIDISTGISMTFIFWNSCMGIHWTLRFSMMRCGPLLTNAGQNDILQKLPKFLRKWRTARLCRNFGNRTAKNFPMRQIWSGTSSWGRCAVYTLSVKRNRAYEEARPLL